jgi:hypothetical protein
MATEKPTTCYGAWATYDGALTVEETIEAYLGDFAVDFDAAGAFSKVVDDFRAAINENLPGGITLNGDNFYGPHPLNDGVRPHELNTLIPEVIEAVDLDAIVEKHDPDAE